MKRLDKVGSSVVVIRLGFFAALALVHVDIGRIDLRTGGDKCGGGGGSLR